MDYGIAYCVKVKSFPSLRNLQGSANFRFCGSQSNVQDYWREANAPLGVRDFTLLGDRDNQWPEAFSGVLPHCALAVSLMWADR